MRSLRAVAAAISVCVLAGTTTAAFVDTTSAAPPSTVPGNTPAAPEPVGEASAIQPAVDLRVVDAEFTILAAPSSVAVGDVLRTDATGYAEVAYLDGSRTRLDVNTEFTVVALVDAAGEASTRTRMGLGRTWHNVESAGQAGEEFAVETSVATATVAGTVFAIQCVAADSCRFVVVEGTIRIELLDGTVIDLVGPASLDVSGGVTTGPTPLAYDAVFSDPWLVDNTQRDVTAGFPDRASIFQALGPAFGSMTGTYTGTLTIDGVSCSTFCLGQWATGAGATFDWSATFSTDCTSGTCALVGGSGFPYSFDGASYRATIESDSPCTFDEGGDGVDVETTGRIISVNNITVTPAAAEVRDGSYVVTSIVFGSHINESVEGICNETQTAATREEMLALPRYAGMTADQSATGTR